ncbi:unnamed protein product [Fusarium graminearum]|nr:unnamed protein product [Fusarium graminearum]
MSPGCGGSVVASTSTLRSTLEYKREKSCKRKQLLPQFSIDHMWRQFSEPVFQKAYNVLPPHTAAASQRFDWSNDLLTTSYERAARDCRQAVQAIVQQCTRFNMRYRDEWDLVSRLYRKHYYDWDLKWGDGNCLNGLCEQLFDLDDVTSLGSTDDVPRSVKRVSEIFEQPTFLAITNGNDVRQGNLGDCWFVAALAALANTNGGIEKICVSHDAKVGVYGFVFHRDGEWIYTLVDDKLYLKSPSWNTPSVQRDLMQCHMPDTEVAKEAYRNIYQTGSRSLFFAQCKDQNETWVPLIEKAYAKAHGDYASLDIGWMGEALEDLSGGVTTQVLISDILDTQQYWDTRLSRVNTDFLFGVAAGVLEDGYGERNGISEGHAYVVMDVFTFKSGQRLIKLGNPWGNHKGKWEGAWSDGSKEWSKEAQEELGHKLGKDSTFWISYEDLLDRVTCFDQTRLFRDSAWRCCQRWASIPVPWKSTYQRAFILHTTDASPLVLVISQLDKRYFKGLDGEYSFRLQFQLRDKDGGTDSFVLSHGNYLMSRSVSLDVPELPRGTYTIYLKVTAERDPDAKSVEDVIFSECEERKNNEKLAQVGSAYDSAHRKVSNMCGLLEFTDFVDSDYEEDENGSDGKPRPWNAVCVIGIRAYSTDAHLKIQGMTGTT